MNHTKLQDTLESGKVTRYHAVPSVRPQNIAHHSWNVAMLLIYITENSCSYSLLVEALMHDTGEYITGDVPFTVKRDHPQIKHLLKEVEREARESMLLPEAELDQRETALLKIADTLEGFIWCALHEDKRGPVEDRWHEAYLVAQAKFWDLLNPSEWQRADKLFSRYGGIVNHPTSPSRL